MAKPTTEPRWADVGGAIVEPPEAKKDVGWIVEKPPHQTFNWWMNLVFQWINFLNISGGSKAKRYFFSQQ